MSLSLQPPRGTQDRFPEEYVVRKHIFDTRRKVCVSFGYDEYLWPLVEPADIWRAKSGEDVGGPELTLITDREGKISDLALRPEMTPTVTRMVASRYRQLPKPVRRFSIANFYRNERPQRGRNREFRQLNVDMFGETSLQAEIEILQLALELMFAFDAPKDSFVLKINHRHLIDTFLLEVVGVEKQSKNELVRLMDKREKIGQDGFIQGANELNCSMAQTEQLLSFLQTTTLDQLFAAFPVLKGQKSLQEIQQVNEILTHLGYADRISFSPALMRGFDYYDGIVFEVFDKHPDNNRAMFGGGRYNGLADIFGVKEQIPAVGFAPGDEPMKLFLESRWLLEQIGSERNDNVFVQRIGGEQEQLAAYQVAKTLRATWAAVEVGVTEKSPKKALEYADKKGYTSAVILWTDELTSGSYKIKNLTTGEQQENLL